MTTVAFPDVFAKLPAAELEASLQTFTEPFSQVLPDERLKRVVPLAVRGILAGETPVITQIARSVCRDQASVWAAAKRLYRFLDNDRFTAQTLLKGLYWTARQVVAAEEPPSVVVALDPVNFEKPYTKKLEGVSTVHKSTPPDRFDEPRLARGYPAITATVVNTRVPVTSYANWFSYEVDFLSQNWEIYRAIRTSRVVLAGRRIRFVGDSGLDDQKMFVWMAQGGQEFVVRAQHLNRKIDVYNERLDRWEPETLQDLVDTVLPQARFSVAFQHAGRSRLTTIALGWFCIRLPANPHQRLWVLVATDEQKPDRAPLVLLTNVAVLSLSIAQSLYHDWRLRGRVEQGYRFDQEQGLDVEEMRVQTLERMRRLFALVLLAASFVFHLMCHWPPRAVLWLRQLGGKLGRSSDHDGPYVLLHGLQALWHTMTTLSLLATVPFPSDALT